MCVEYSSNHIFYVLFNKCSEPDMSLTRGATQGSVGAVGAGSTLPDGVLVGGRRPARVWPSRDRPKA